MDGETRYFEIVSVELKYSSLSTIRTENFLQIVFWFNLYSHHHPELGHPLTVLEPYDRVNGGLRLTQIQLKCS